jgi:hypothetical protein
MAHDEVSRPQPADDSDHVGPPRTEAIEPEREAGPGPTTGSAGSGSKVVARLLDGTRIKGHTWNFSPNKPRFHVFPVPEEGTGEPVEVWLRDLKAVFFVHDFEGSPDYDEQKEPVHGGRPGHTLEVTLADGEVMVGSSIGYDAQRLGFFFFPIDYGSNNQRIFLPSSAVKKIRRV